MGEQITAKPVRVLAKVQDAQSVPAVQAQGEAGQVMQMINQVALMPDVDMERLERLYDMHKEVTARDAETAFNAALAQAQEAIQGVATDKLNKHTRKGYASLEAIHREAKPIWTGHGFSVVTRTSKSEIQNHIHVVTQIRHAAGHKEVLEDDWPLDNVGTNGNANKTAIQAKGSSTSYARRYNEMAFFDIAIEHEDNDGQPIHQLSSKAQSAIQAIEGSRSVEELMGVYGKYYKTLTGFDRNQLIKAYEAKKVEFNG